jgi:hypothetical protein
MGLRDAKEDEEVRASCREILETISPRRVKRSARGGDYYIELPPGGAAWWVYLGPWDDDSVAVRIYPGNIIRQARTFFQRTRKQEFFGLERKGWEIQPYLCFCYIAWGRRATGIKLTAEQYFDYWASAEISQIRRKNNGFEEFSQRLRAQRLIGARDQRNIKRDYIETKRDFMNVCPGFEVVFGWGRVQANKLDRGQGFVEAVRDRANEALRTWGQTL